MKPSFLPSLVLATACLLSVGTISHLAAQSAPVFVAKNGDLITPPLTRTYSGPVTQTTAAGVTTTGTMTISYYKGGGLTAATILNGVTTTYSGSLLPSPPALAFLSIAGKKVRNSGVLNSFDKIAAPGGLVNTGVYITAQLPVFVDKSVAFGGLQNADGSLLTFRATRDAE